MKANELRIGNFVTINNPEHWKSLKNIPLVVTAIKDTCAEFEFSIGLSPMKATPLNWQTYAQFNCYIEPILLTEEWILKFGFKKTDCKCECEEDNLEYYEKNKLTICNWGGKGFVMSNAFSHGLRINLIYVHQLQNLYFVLIGEELYFNEFEKLKER